MPLSCTSSLQGSLGATVVPTSSWELQRFIPKPKPNLEPDMTAATWTAQENTRSFANLKRVWHNFWDRHFAVCALNMRPYYIVSDTCAVHLRK